MKRKAKRRQVPTGGLVKTISGVLTAAALTIVLILIVAVLLRYGVFTDSAIPIINQVIKVLGIALAAFIAVGTPCTRPWLRGMMAGLFYILAGLIIFSAIAGAWDFSLSNLADMAMGIGVGAIIGLLFGKK